MPGASAVIHPKFHHFNLKTTRLQEMIDWYATVVGADVLFQDALGAWLSNDEANHRIALLAFPNFVDDPDKDTHTGLHHSAFEYASFEELNASYLRLRDAGILPALCLDHGMTLSYYYADPDGNNVELQVDCFGDWARSSEWMRNERRVPREPNRRVRAAGHDRRRPLGRARLCRHPREGDVGRLRTRAGARRDPRRILVRLCRFTAGGPASLGLVDGGRVADLSNVDPAPDVGEDARRASSHPRAIGARRWTPVPPVEICNPYGGWERAPMRIDDRGVDQTIPKQGDFT